MIYPGQGLKTAHSESVEENSDYSMRQHYWSIKNYNHIGPKTDSSPTIIDDKPWIRLFAADWYGMIPDKRYYLNFYTDVVFSVRSVKSIKLNDMREQTLA